MTWEELLNRMFAVVEWYAIERVLVEEYERGESKYIEACGYDPMTENEYYERKGRCMGYADAIRAFGIPLDGEMVHTQMAKFMKDVTGDINDSEN